LVEKDTPTVGPDAPIAKLKEVFAKGKVACVVDGGKVTGIVTKIDMIDFLAKNVA
jgi:cystathionine beta-synthase